mmetsp:Transcript_8747/g.11113  ORF Transcript_8747/g.11113 Transcript_8747/m.11113 type:complete len:200 (+) Transcript_8747:1405-2004(+)
MTRTSAVLVASAGACRRVLRVAAMAAFWRCRSRVSLSMTFARSSARSLCSLTKLANSLNKASSFVETASAAAPGSFVSLISASSEPPEVSSDVASDSPVPPVDSDLFPPVLSLLNERPFRASGTRLNSISRLERGNVNIRQPSANCLSFKLPSRVASARRAWLQAWDRRSALFRSPLSCPSAAFARTNRSKSCLSSENR